MPPDRGDVQSRFNESFLLERPTKAVVSVVHPAEALLSGACVQEAIQNHKRWTIRPNVVHPRSAAGLPQVFTDFRQAMRCRRPQQVLLGVITGPVFRPFGLRWPPHPLGQRLWILLRVEVAHR